MISEIVNFLSIMANAALAVSAGIGYFSLKKYKNTYTRYFIYFLIYVFLMELIANYPKLNALESFAWTKDNKFLNNNFWYYTIFWTIASAVFYSYYFQKVLKIKRFKSLLKYGRFAFIALSVIWIVKDYNKFFTFGFVILDYLNTVLIIGSVILFFLEILLTNRILTFYRDINFYIASSILIWWLITMPLSIFSDYYNANDMHYVYLHRILIYASSIFMYSCFAIGLIVSKPKH
ncbi:hypothetical protein [Lacinutrix sp. MEBiC02595]